MYYTFYRKKFRKHGKMEELEFRSDPDPLFPEVDPLIRNHIKMKRIRNTDFMFQKLTNCLKCKKKIVKIAEMSNGWVGGGVDEKKNF